jgi:hypothetical protein
MIINVHKTSRKGPVIHVKFYNKTWIVSTDFSENMQILNFIKIRPVGAELFHADGRTGMTKLVGAFRDRAKQPKKG